MPPRRKYSYRRRRGRRVGRYARVSMSKSAPSLELKYHDVSGSIAPGNASLASGAGGSFIIGGSLNLIPQGTGEDERIGRRALLKSISCRLQLHVPVQVSGSGNIYAGYTWRAILILDRQCNGAYPVWSTVLEPDVVYGQLNNYNNMSEKGRFQTLVDKKVAVTPPITVEGTNNQTAGTTMLMDVYKKVHIPIQYSGVGDPTISQITGNNLFWMVALDVTPGDTFPTGADARIKTRLRFTD